MCASDIRDHDRSALDPVVSEGRSVRGAGRQACIDPVSLAHVCGHPWTMHGRESETHARTGVISIIA